MSSTYWISSNWQNIQLYCFIAPGLATTVAIKQGTLQ